MKKHGGERWDPPLHHVLKQIRSLPLSFAVVGISGYGGSGKTTLAQAVGQRLSAAVVSLDKFGTAGVFGRSDDWGGFDRPRLVRQVLAPLASGVRQASYDGSDDWQSWETSRISREVCRFVVVEGVGLFHPDLLPYLNYRIWVDVPLAEATARGIARERALGREAEAVWTSLWEPNDRDFDQKFQRRNVADYWMRPVISAGRKGPFGDG